MANRRLRQPRTRTCSNLHDIGIDPERIGPELFGVSWGLHDDGDDGGPPPLLHPSMALQYRKRVHQLYEALQDEEEETRIEAADILRSLVDKIVLTPVNGKM